MALCIHSLLGLVLRSFRASVVAAWLVVLGLELCSVAGSSEAGLAWSLCSGGMLCCTLAFPSILFTLSEMLCISEHMESWLVPECSSVPVVATSPGHWGLAPLKKLSSRER